MGGRELLVYVRTVVTAIFVMTVVTLRVGARAKEGRREEGGEEKIRLPDIIVLLGNSIRWQTELLIGAA